MLLVPPWELWLHPKRVIHHYAVNPQAYSPAHIPLTPTSLCVFQAPGRAFLLLTLPPPSDEVPQDRGILSLWQFVLLALSSFRLWGPTVSDIITITYYYYYYWYNLLVMAKHVPRPLPSHSALSLLQTLRNNASILLFSHKFLSLW